MITKTKDMTYGDPLKLILLFALPLFIGNIFQQLYSIVDTMIAGYCLGDEAIAAIGATSSLYALLIDFAWGLNSGYGIVIARAFGSGDREELKRTIAAAIVLDVLITVLLTVISLAALHPLLRLLNIPADIYDDAYDYIMIILAGMVMTILYNMSAGILRAVGNSRTPLYFLIFSSIANGGLDALFIIAFGWGVRGAAWATVIAQSLSAVFSCMLLLWRYRELLPERRHFRPEAGLIGEMVSTGFAMSIMLCVVDLGSVFYQRAVNLLGPVLIVAHTAARRIIGIMMMPLSSLCTANSTFVSQNWGAENTERIRTSMRIVILLEIAWGLFSCLLVWLFGGRAVQLLTSTDDPVVIEKAVLSLRLHFSCYPALGVLLAMRTGMQAIGMKTVPVISSSLELAVKLICGFWLIPAYGYICVCLAEPFIWVICMIFLIIVWHVRRPLSGIASKTDPERPEIPC